MWVRREILLLVFIQLWLCSSGLVDEPISESNLKKHLEIIASDSLQGRGLDSDGLEQAAFYIRNTLEKEGLKPGVEGYFQSVEIIKGKHNLAGAQLISSLDQENVNSKSDQLIPLPNNRSSVSFSGNLVFARFGRRDGKTGHDDLKGLDLKGKVVAVSLGNQTSFDKVKRGKMAVFDMRLEQEKIDRILKSGASGIVMLTSPFDSDKLYNKIKSRGERESFFLKDTHRPPLPANVVLAPASVFDEITGGKNSLVKALRNRTSKHSHNSPEWNNRFVSVSIPFDSKEISGKNIMAVVEGSDPELQHECVVFMAHYDHLGVDEKGDVFNGADDNGSGTAVLLELARKFRNLPAKPKRSILFLWVTGEEVGMFGSEFYTSHPIFPLKKTKACINLDMAGRVFEPRDTVWKNTPKMVKPFDGIYTLSGYNSSELVQISDNACKKLGLLPDKLLPANFLRSSDHFHFYTKGVPIMNYSTGYHADYHKPTDEVSKINFQKMKRVAELCFEVGFEVANLSGEPAEK